MAALRIHGRLFPSSETRNPTMSPFQFSHALTVTFDSPNFSCQLSLDNRTAAVLRLRAIADDCAQWTQSVGNIFEFDELKDGRLLFGEK